ncbi:unnamed protein product [Cercopithifilaria johnstoni]|uniref:Uncharacterized protein n=1 Tax=Cercopithifilaria johnstoni TaxID=2874296 RepID=A0A8J2M4T2_9BILA|nr:unnamed protein product [Cercopithifilaria johnstoni]
MHSGGAKYDQGYYNIRRNQVQSYRPILTIDPVQQLPLRIGAHILRQLSLKQRTRKLHAISYTITNQALSATAYRCYSYRSSHRT